MANTVGRPPKHGKVATKVYYAWVSMKKRCLNPSYTCYKNYGGRGITVCDEWVASFEAFLADMGEPEVGYSLDRIDNTKGYYKENCRWANPTTQANNRSSNVRHKDKTIAEWSREIGLSPQVIYYRVKKMGMSVEEALFTPKMRRA